LGWIIWWESGVFGGNNCRTNDLYDTSLGNAEVSDVVTAVFDWFGPIDFSTMDAEFAALGTTGTIGATSSASSPESAYMGKTVGAADKNIRISQPENFEAALAKVLGESKVTFEKIEGAGHGTSEF